MAAHRLSARIVSGTLLLLLGASTVLAGCNRPTGARLTPKRPAFRDQSLTDDKYVALGMPAHDHAWTGQELAAAQSTLTTLAAAHPEQLPHAGSPTSGATFARMVAAENLAPFRSRTTPLDARLGGSLQYLQSTGTLLQLYLAAFQKGNNASDADMIELSGSTLRVAQVLMELLDELLPTLKPDDPNHATQMAGLDKMRDGLAQMVNGTLLTLTDDVNLTPASRQKLLAYCRETFPNIVAKLTPESRAQVLRRLDQLVTDPAMRDLQPEITKLRDESRAAANKAGN